MTGNKSFEKVANFKRLGTAVTNKSCLDEEIRVFKFCKCFLPFSSEYFVFSSPVLRI